MGGKEIETDKEQEPDSDQPQMILKPLLEGVHGSPLEYFGVVGLTAEENLADLSREAIHRIAFSAP
jgi:hypothetical protein